MAAIKQVSSFQTSDGKLHQNKGDALTHQLMVDVRGIMQRSNRFANGAVTVTAMAEIVAGKADEFYDLLLKYRAQMRPYRKPLTNLPKAVI